MCKVLQTKSQIRETKDGRPSHAQTSRSTTLYILWGRYVWPIRDQATKKWNQTLWSHVYVYGKLSCAH